MGLSASAKASSSNSTYALGEWERAAIEEPIGDGEWKEGGALPLLVGFVQGSNTCAMGVSGSKTAEAPVKEHGQQISSVTG